MGNSMGLILEARSSPPSFLLPSGSVAYGKAVMHISHCFLMLFVESIVGSIADAPSGWAGLKSIRSGDDIPINRVKHRGSCFGNNTIEDYDLKRI